jgi:hypothetical protein
MIQVTAWLLCRALEDAGSLARELGTKFAGEGGMKIHSCVFAVLVSIGSGCSSTATSFSSADAAASRDADKDSAAFPDAVTDTRPVCEPPEIATALADQPLAASVQGKPLLLTSAFARLSMFQGSGVVPHYDVSILTGSSRTCASRPGSAGPEQIARIRVPLGEGAACSPGALNFGFFTEDGGSSTGTGGQTKGRVEIFDVRPSSNAFSMRVNLTFVAVSPSGGGGGPRVPDTLTGTLPVTICP